MYQSDRNVAQVLKISIFGTCETGFKTAIGVAEWEAECTLLKEHL